MGESKRNEMGLFLKAFTELYARKK
jgi:hypothetical protein